MPSVFTPSKGTHSQMSHLGEDSIRMTAWACVPLEPQRGGHGFGTLPHLPLPAPRAGSPAGSLEHHLLWRKGLSFRDGGWQGARVPRTPALTCPPPCLLLRLGRSPRSSGGWGLFHDSGSVEVLPPQRGLPRWPPTASFRPVAGRGSPAEDTPLRVVLPTFPLRELKFLRGGEDACGWFSSLSLSPV